MLTKRQAAITRRSAKLPPIRDRIRAAFGGRLRANYWKVMEDVFPAEHFPFAGNYSSNGGPSGCAMALGAALRRMGGGWSIDEDGDRYAWLPSEDR